MLAPLPGEQADAARCGIKEHRLAGLDRVAAVEQVFDRHALEHGCGGEFIADAIRGLEQAVGDDVTNIGIGAGAAAGVADAITGGEAAHAGAGLEHHAGRLVAQARRQGHGIKAGALVDLLEVEADCALAHLHLARARIGQVYGFELEYLGAAGCGETDDAGLGGHESCLLVAFGVWRC